MGHRKSKIVETDWNALDQYYRSWFWDRWQRQWGWTGTDLRDKEIGSRQNPTANWVVRFALPKSNNRRYEDRFSPPFPVDIRYYIVLRFYSLEDLVQTGTCLEQIWYKEDNLETLQFWFFFSWSWPLVHNFASSCHFAKWTRGFGLDLE